MKRTDLALKASGRSASWPEADEPGAISFDPPWYLRNRHLMTILGNLRHRRFPVLDGRAERREFRTEPETTVVAFAHWQLRRRESPTVVIVHGLEGSADAGYVLGTSSKAWAAGFNVIRCNVRNCGGTEHLTPTLYHSGLTVDLHHLLRELIEEDRLEQIFLIGFSMGGNQALKFAGELGRDAPRQLRGVCAISPPIDLALCSRALGRPENRLYERRFLRSLRARMRRKRALFPDRYDLSRLARVRSLWDFDQATASYNGFRDALDYYTRSSALPFIPMISTPTLIIHAQDDPFIPVEPFRDRRLTSQKEVRLLETRYGGHVAFVARRRAAEDRAWAENRAVEYCRLLYGNPT
jgi:predicted alpha/beta-fold hydrolase